VKWSCTFNVLIGSAALLLPLTAATESHLQTGATNAGLSATAQVNFKIVIPRVLYLHLAGGSEGAQTVAVMSNSHNVTLNASTGRPDDGGSAHGNVILNAGARKPVAQEAVCSMGERLGPPVAAGRLICTASMP
jgi:hypothetical protein